MDRIDQGENMNTKFYLTLFAIAALIAGFLKITGCTEADLDHFVKCFNQGIGC